MPWLAVIDQVRSDPEVAPVVCGVGCGGPMLAEGETVSPLNIAGLARLPPPRSTDRRRWGCRYRSTTTPRRWRWGRDGWVRPGAWTTTSPWWCPPGSAAASCSTVGCSTGQYGNAGHIGHVVVEPDGRGCVCGGRGCLEAEASGCPSPLSPAAPAAEARRGTPPHRDAGRPGGGLGGQPARPASWRWWPVRWPWDSGASSSRRPRRRSRLRSRLDFSRGTRIDPGRSGRRRAPGRCGRRRSPGVWSDPASSRDPR